MTINTTPARVQYTATSGQTAFTVTFVFSVDTDLLVYLTPVGSEADDTADLLTLTTDYTVTGAGYSSSTRTVTLVTPATSGDTITIVRNKALTRTTDFVVGGAFTASDLNAQFDDLVVMVQDNRMLMEQLGLLYQYSQILNASRSQNVLPKLPNNDSVNIPIWTTNSVGDLVAGTLAGSAGYSTLRSELAVNTVGNDGAKLIGYYDPPSSPNSSTSPLGATTLAIKVANLEARLAKVEADEVGDPTGTIKYGYTSTAPTGWIILEDTTIGNASSGAETRANADCENLFTLIWNRTAEGYCRIFDSSGNQVSKGASASADWSANRRIETPKIIDRFLIPSNANSTITQSFTTDYATATSIINPVQPGATSAAAERYTTGMPITLTTTGTLPTGLATGTTYYVYLESDTEIKLASSTTNLTSATYVTFSDDGTGTHSISMPQLGGYGLGSFGGYQSRVQLKSEMPQHDHTFELYSGNTTTNPFASRDDSHLPSETDTTTTAGSSGSFDIQNAYTSAIAFMKL